MFRGTVSSLMARGLRDRLLELTDKGVNSSLIIVKPSFGKYEVTFDIVSPKEKLMWVCGMRVGLETSMIYVGKNSDSEVMPLFTMSDVFSSLLGRRVSKDRILQILQTFKLNGKGSALFELLSEISDSSGSLSYRVIMSEKDNMGITPPEVIMNVFESIIKVVSFLNSLSTIEAVSDDGREYDHTWFPNLILPSLLNAPSVSVDGYGDYLYKISSKEINKDLIGNIKYTKSYLIAANMADFLETFEKESELIYSEDTDKWFNRLGIDKIVSPRELSSIKSSWRVMKVEEIFKKRLFLSINSIKITYTGKKSPVGVKYDMVAGSFVHYDIFNKSIVYLDKLLDKIYDKSILR